MAYNRIQFQHGMSLPEFIQCFGTETACVDALQRVRWLAGHICPRCGDSALCVVGSASRRRFQCNAHHVQTSMSAGTLFASTKLPLTTWFLAIFRKRLGVAIELTDPAGNAARAPPSSARCRARRGRQASPARVDRCRAHLLLQRRCCSAARHKWHQPHPAAAYSGGPDPKPPGPAAR